MTRMGDSHRNVYSRVLQEIMVENPRHVVLDGDTANSSKVDAIAHALPKQFYQMGIAEQNMISVAAGMATCGLIPWVNTFTVFLAKRAIDQIRVSVAQTHANVKLVGSYSGLLTGFTGKTHQSVEDLAIFRAMPNMTILAPADEVELTQCLHYAAFHAGPMYLRLHRDPAGEIFDNSYRFEFGKGVVLKRGHDVSLISTGPQTMRVAEAAKLLENQGLSVGLVHLPTIKPFDQEAIIQAAKDSHRVVVVEEHSIVGGLGGAVCELLSEHYPTHVLRIGVPDVFGESAPNETLLDKYGLNPERIRETVNAWLPTKVYSSDSLA